MNTSQKPRALSLADKYEIEGFLGDHRFVQELWCRLITTKLRNLYARIAELEAARIAYASEFEPDASGDPDVGNIHANIRAMKAKLAATPEADAGNPASTSATMSDEQIKAVFLANGFTIKEGMTDLKPYVYQAARALLATVGAGGVEPLRKPVEDGWLQDGPLLYRLTDERRSRNRDEIIVTMANSSRTEEARTRRAGELLDAVRATAPQADQADALDALDAARYRFLRDTCWSSDKELATVISLQMNKVWDEKIDEAMARNKRSN